jgi:hypothetical protein
VRAVKAVARKKSEDRHKSIEEGCEKARSEKKQNHQPDVRLPEKRRLSVD